MKKKGLIVATIVMVLVLAVSLTTATYAWFNNQASVKVDDVTVAVASASSISLGILKTPSSSATSPTSYVNGNMFYVEDGSNPGKGMGTFHSVASTSTTTWTDETDTDVLEGLGSSVNWNWSLSSLGGVSSGTGTVGNNAAFDDPYDASHALYNGSYASDAATDPTVDSIATYNKQTLAPTTCTVIYAPFGVKAEKSGLNYLYCDITITANSTSFLGIVAALKLEISGTDVAYSDHPFEATTTGGLMTSACTYQTNPSASPFVSKAVTFRFVIAYNATEIPYTESSIYPFKVRMFIDGEDVNCCANATKYNAKIGIAFNAEDAEAYASSVSGKIVKNLSSAVLP